jgi:hypothetical protein
MNNNNHETLRELRRAFFAAAIMLSVVMLGAFLSMAIK